MDLTKKQPIATGTALERWVYTSQMGFCGYYEASILENHELLKGKGLYEMVDMYVRKVHDFDTHKDTNHVLLCWKEKKRNDKDENEYLPKFLKFEGEQADQLIKFRNDYEAVQDCIAKRLTPFAELKYMYELITQKKG